MEKLCCHVSMSKSYERLLQEFLELFLKVIALFCTMFGSSLVYIMNLGYMFQILKKNLLRPSYTKSKKVVVTGARVALTPSRWTAVGISTLLLMTCYVPGAGPLTWRWSLSSWVR